MRDYIVEVRIMGRNHQEFGVKAVNETEAAAKACAIARKRNPNNRVVGATCVVEDLGYVNYERAASTQAE